MNTDFKGSDRLDISVCRECIVIWPALSHIDYFQENTCPLPLQIDKYIDIWIVSDKLVICAIRSKIGDRSCIYRLKACNCFKKLLLTATGNSRNTEDFSAVCVEAYIVENLYAL